jgi:alkylhydroperoxidase family enzyme
VILRAAYRKQSTYEWHQHVRIARDAGLSDDEINAVKEWRASPLFDEGDRVVLAYVDALADSPRPDDAAFEAVAASRSTGEVFGLTFLVTLYFQLAHVMAAFDLETEEPFIGWDVPARA